MSPCWDIQGGKLWCDPKRKHCSHVRGYTGDFFQCKSKKTLLVPPTQEKNELAAYTEQILPPLQLPIFTFNDGGLHWDPGQYYYYAILTLLDPSFSNIVAGWRGLSVPLWGQNCEHFVHSRSNIDLRHSNLSPAMIRFRNNQLPGDAWDEQRKQRRPKTPPYPYFLPPIVCGGVRWSV